MISLLFRLIDLRRESINPHYDDEQDTILTPSIVLNNFISFSIRNSKITEKKVQQLSFKIFHLCSYDYVNLIIYYSGVLIISINASKLSS